MIFFLHGKKVGPEPHQCGEIFWCEIFFCGIIEFKDVQYLISRIMLFVNNEKQTQNQWAQNPTNAYLGEIF